MESKKINQLATEMSPAISDLTIIGDPITGVSKKITLLQIADLFQTTGTVTSVAVTESGNALNITGSPITTAGTINIGFAGSANQYVRGDGALAPFPTSTGGGSSVSYYLNGSVNQGTFGGSTYYQMSKNAIVGTGTNFSISSNGLIAQFITDANDPDVVQIPSGNWNLEFFMNVSASSGALASFYVEFYKYNGSTFTLLATNVATPEELTNTTTVDAYYTSVAMPTSALSITDRLAIRIYANVAGKTVTLYTEDNRLCQVVTTFSKGLASLNNLTDQSQYLTTGTSGTNFAIVSSGDTHTFNLPVASATNTGKLSSTDWSTFNGKVPYTGATANVDLGFFSLSSKTLTANGNAGSSGSLHLKQNDTINVAGINYGTIATNTLQQFVFYWEDASFAKRFNLDFSSLTALGTAKTFTLPDASGTLALTSNLSAYVPYTGAISDVNLGTYSITGGIGTFTNGVLNGNGTNPANLYLKKGSAPFFTNANNYGLIAAVSSSFILISDVDGTNYKYASFNLGSLTNNTNRAFTLPDLSGTLTLLEGTQTFSGAKTFSGLASFTNTSGINMQYGAYINKGNTPLAFSSGTTNIYSDATTNNIVIRDNSSIAKLEFNNSTQTYTFPAASGTIALTSNIPSITGLVPYTGATTNVNLGVYSLTANQLIAGGAGVNNAGTFTTYDGGVATQLIGSTGNLKFFPLWNPSIGARINAENSAGSAYIPLSFYASNFYFHSNVNFNSTIGNGTFTYTLPSATGTLALTSNLSAYLPLTGGTLTGNLTGTTAIFNGSVDVVNGQINLSNSYYLTARNNANNTFLRLIGRNPSDKVVIDTDGYGTILGGALSGTSAAFSSSMFVNSPLNNTVITTSDATNITNGFNLLASSSYWGIRTSTNGNFNLDVFGAGVPKNALIIAQSTGAATFSDSVTNKVTNISADGAGVVLQGYVDNSLRIAVRGSGYNSGARGGLLASTGDFSSSVSATQGTFTSNDTFAQDSSGQIVIRGASNTAKRLGIGFDTTNNYAYLQAIEAGVATRPLVLQPFGGNVGIGTSSPFAIADVNTSINGTGSSALQLGVGGTRIAQFFATSGEVRLSAVSNVPMLFYTNDTERMRITSDGNVGIGNSNPQNYGSTYVSLTIGSSTRIGILKFRSSYNSGDGAEIYQTTSGAIIFNINGSTSGASISSGGVFNIVNLAGSGSRAVLADASGNLSAPVSDISVKQNITSIGYGLNEILKMNPVWFDFIDEYKNYGEGRQNGNIAQEMQEIIPEAVFVTPSTGKMGINYDQMHAVYIKAIQEQTQIIKDLEARIKQLENK